MTHFHARALLVPALLPALLDCTAGTAGTAVAPVSRPAAVAITQDSMQWVENPAIPAGARITLLAGKFTAPGPYAFRVRFPADYRVMPHSHPDDRMYTVIEGTWSIGLGERFDPSALREYPAGSVYFLPANTPHYHSSKAPSVAQINAVGPTATVYVNPADDPRRK